MADEPLQGLSQDVARFSPSAAEIVDALRRQNIGIAQSFAIVDRARQDNPPDNSLTPYKAFALTSQPESGLFPKVFLGPAQPGEPDFESQQLLLDASSRQPPLVAPLESQPIAQQEVPVTPPEAALAGTPGTEADFAEMDLDVEAHRARLHNNAVLSAIESEIQASEMADTQIELQRQAGHEPNIDFTSTRGRIEKQWNNRFIEKSFVPDAMDDPEAARLARSWLDARAAHYQELNQALGNDPRDHVDDAAIIEYLVTPLQNLATFPRQVFNSFEAASLAKMIVDMEFKERFKHNLVEFEEDRFVTLSSTDTPIITQGTVLHDFGNGTFVANRTQMRRRILDDLNSGFPLVSERAASLADAYYEALQKSSPKQLPHAQGFFARAAQVAGDLARFGVEQAVFRRAFGRALASGKLPHHTATSVPFAVDAAISGGDPLDVVKAGVTGGLIGKISHQASRATTARGQLLGNAALGGTFGLQTLSGGGGPLDVLISGVGLPLVFNFKSIIRFPFKPKLEIPTRSVETAPSSWRGFANSNNPVEKVIFRWHKLAEQSERDGGYTETGLNEIKATGKVIQRMAEKSKDLPEQFSRYERDLLNSFMDHISELSKVKPASENVSQKEQQPAQAKESQPQAEPSKLEPTAVPRETKPVETPETEPKVPESKAVQERDIPGEATQAEQNVVDNATQPPKPTSELVSVPLEFRKRLTAFRRGEADAFDTTLVAETIDRGGDLSDQSIETSLQDAGVPQQTIDDAFAIVVRNRALGITPPPEKAEAVVPPTKIPKTPDELKTASELAERQGVTDIPEPATISEEPKPDVSQKPTESIAKGRREVIKKEPRQGEPESQRALVAKKPDSEKVVQKPQAERPVAAHGAGAGGPTTIPPPAESTQRDQPISKPDQRRKGIAITGTDRGGAGDVPSKPRGSADPGGTLRGRTQPTGVEPDPGRRARSAGPGDRDYLITPQDELFSGTPKPRAWRNVNAIKTAKEILAQNREATPEEQAILVGYTGWGALKDAIVGGKGFRDVQKELKSILTDEEFKAAEDSIRNAMYTPPDIIAPMYRAAQSMGIAGGPILEPSSGVGHFFGLMPPELRLKSRRTGVEKDAVTGTIAKLLYPDSTIFVQPFEQSQLPDNHFDLIVGNVPFLQVGVQDKRYPKFARQTLHDYFLTRASDLVRPGGVVMFVTSKGTMDKMDTRHRAFIGERLDLLGATRLHHDALPGTKVTADLLVFQKPVAGAKRRGHQFTSLVKVPEEMKDPEFRGQPMAINEFFVAHPKQVLGKLVKQSLFGAPTGARDTGVVPAAGDLVDLVTKALEMIPRDVVPKRGIVTRKILRDAGRPNIPDGTIIRVEGRLGIKGGSGFEELAGELVKSSDGPKVLARIGGQVDLRDAVLAQMELESSDASEAVISKSREKLNNLYDQYRKQFGHLRSRANMDVLATDFYTQSILHALEDVSIETTSSGKKRNRFKKSLIFSDRVQARQVERKASNIKDATAIALDETGSLDLVRMAELLDVSPDQVKRQLLQSADAFLETDGSLVTADEYLSGNVREKLKSAEIAAQSDSSYKDNVEALRRVVPRDLTAPEIRVNLGSAWIDPPVVQEFTEHLLGLPLELKYEPAGGTWVVKDPQNAQAEPISRQKWGIEDYPAPKIIDDILNLRTTRVTFKDLDGNLRTDSKKTDQARVKSDAIKTEWGNWIWSDPQRRENLLRYYNETQNAIVPRKWDGSHMTFPGLVPGFVPHPHQRTGVYRALAAKGNTLLYHAVGAGKTFEYAAIAMESRRLGIRNKPLLVTFNGNHEQVVEQIRGLYPGKRILAPPRNGFDKARRAKTLAQIGLGDWDLVIIPQSRFSMIPMSVESVSRFRKQQLEELESAIREAKADRSESTKRLVKEISNARDRLNNQLTKLIEIGKKDPALNWEQLGIDLLMVDESDGFKNLFYYSKLQNVKGLGNPQGAGKSLDLWMKIQHLLASQNGSGVVFGTGTPVANSATEIQSILRYLKPEFLRNQNTTSMDAWIQQYGERSDAVERTAEGDYRTMTRLRKFSNVPELMRGWLELVDVVDVDQVREIIGPDKFPRMAKNSAGQRSPEMVIVEPSEQLENYMVDVRARALRLKKNPDFPKDIDNFLKITTDMRVTALDTRFRVPGAPPGNKIITAASKIAEIWHEFNPGKKPNQRKTQLVFVNNSTPKPKERDPVETLQFYDELIQRLVDLGVPRDQIDHPYNRSKARVAELYDKVQRGEVTVLIGSMQAMGIGVNVQRQVIGVHELDPTWVPRFFEQAKGRWERQGNLNPEVRVFRYATRGSGDEFMYHVLLAKSAMINQIRKGDLTVREFEELDAETMDFTDIAAATSNNPEIMRWRQVEGDFRRMEARVANARNEVSQIVSQQKRLQEVVPRNGENVAELKKAIAARGAEPFDVVVSGERFEKFGAELGGAIAGNARELPAEGKRNIGSVGPHTMELERRHFGSREVDLRVLIDPVGAGFTFDVTEDMTTSEQAGLASKLRRALLSLDKELKSAEALQTRQSARLEEITRRLPEAQASVGPLEKQLESLKEEFDDLAQAVQQAEKDIARDASQMQKRLSEEIGQGTIPFDPPIQGEIEPPNSGAGTGAFPPTKEPTIADKFDQAATFGITLDDVEAIRKRAKRGPQHPFFFGVGGQGAIPDPRGLWKRVYDRIEKKLQTPGTSLVGKMKKYFGRGFSGMRWGMNEAIYRRFEETRGTRKLAEQTVAEINELTKKHLAKLEDRYTSSERQALKDKLLVDAIEGRTDPGDLPDDLQKVFITYTQTVRDNAQEVFELKHLHKYFNGMGLSNWLDVVRMRDQAPGSYLRRVYEPLKQPNSVADQVFGPLGSMVKAKRIPMGVGTIKSGLFKPRQSTADDALPVWHVRTANGKATAFFDEDSATDYFFEQRELAVERFGPKSAQAGKVKLIDPFDNEVVKALLPIEDVNIRMARSIVDFRVSIELLKLFDYLAETVGIPHPSESSWIVKNAIGEFKTFESEQTARAHFSKELEAAAKLFGEKSNEARRIQIISPGDGKGRYADILEITRPPDVPENYVRLPKSENYGPLAGMWVPEPVAYNIQATELVFEGFLPDLWRMFNLSFKVGKTVFNPLSHMNQWLGTNISFAFDGIHPVMYPKEFKKAVRHMNLKSRSRIWKKLVAANEINVGFSGETLRRYEQIFKNTNFRLGLTMYEAAQKALRMTDKPSKAFDYTDPLSKMFSFIVNTERRGMTETEAINRLKYYPNYARRGTYAKWAANHPAGSTFVNFTDSAAKSVLFAMRNAAGKLLGVAMLPGLITLASKIIAGYSDEEIEVLNQSPNRKGDGMIGVMNRYFQPIMPWRGENGEPQSIDLRWKYWFGDIFNIETGTGGILTPFLMSTPAAKAMTEIMTNRDLFTGRAIEKDTLSFYGALKVAIKDLHPLPSLVSRGFWNLYTAGVSGEPERFFAVLLREIFGIGLAKNFIRRGDVIDLIKEKLGAEDAKAAAKIMDAYNRTWGRRKFRGSRQKISPAAVRRSFRRDERRRKMLEREVLGK